MKHAQYERNGHTIKDLETGKRTPHASINAAKKWSASKQRSLGGLGLGTVRVVT